MKIAVVGPGAMGCLLAAFLQEKAKQEVWLIDKHEERSRRIHGQGLKVEGISGTFDVGVNVTTRAADAGACDIAFICTKSYDTEDACKEIKDLVGEKTAVVTLQNGIGNVQILIDQFGQDRVAGGITSHGATLIDTGHVRHAGRGDTIIGRPDRQITGSLKNIQYVLAKAGFPTKLSKDINSIIWSKLIINVGINALTAVTRLRNGMLLEYEGTRELLKRGVAEAVKVAKRKKAKLLYEDPIQKVESVCRATATNISSMLQDILNGKRTEIDYINGAIVRHGESLNIETPVNAVLTDLVKTIESSYERQER